MEYIAYKRFKGKALCGDVNIPALTLCEEINGCIYCGGKALCFATSENAHQYFTRNNDGYGMLRGKLIQTIQKRLAKQDGHYQERWNKVWIDSTCQLYKRHEHADFWLWNHDFFQADIEVLQYIANLIGVKGGK